MHIFGNIQRSRNSVYNECALLSLPMEAKTFSQYAHGDNGDNHQLWINPVHSQYMVNANDGGAIDHRPSPKLVRRTGQSAYGLSIYPRECR